MVIGIIGENCSGKSTLAEEIKKEIGAKIISGKDYLRMAKSPSEAEVLFRSKLKEAVCGENIIYVIAEKEQINFLPETSVRILVKADISTIKERFRQRMHGNLPASVEEMLERKHGMFDDISCDYQYNSDTDEPSKICEQIKERLVNQ